MEQNKDTRTNEEMWADANLSPAERFAKGLPEVEELDDEWDKQMKVDAAAGKFDAMAEEAVKEWAEHVDGIYQDFLQLPEANEDDSYFVNTKEEFIERFGQATYDFYDAMSREELSQHFGQSLNNIEAEFDRLMKPKEENETE